MNWIQDTLDKVNSDLKKKQKQQEARLMENGSLDDFNRWSMTIEEDKAINLLARATRGYKDQRGIPGKVMKFARSIAEDDKARKFKVLNVQVEDIMSYIDHSGYWETSHLTVSGIKIVYAKNEDMKCVICYFKNKFILTTASSFTNILREIVKQIDNGSYEGKLQHLPKTRTTHRYESHADDYRQPWVRNNLDMDKYTF